MIDNAAKYRPASKLNNSSNHVQYPHTTSYNNFQPVQGDLNLGEIKLTQQQAMMLL